MLKLQKIEFFYEYIKILKLKLNTIKYNNYNKHITIEIYTQWRKVNIKIRS